MVSIKNKPLFRQVFFQGLVEGLGAPALMFKDHALPAIPNELVLLEPITAEQAIHSDWARVGADFHQVIKSHGPKRPAAADKKKAKRKRR